jgi:hypothetical protein
MDDDIDDIFFEGHFLCILLKDNIIVGKEGIGAHRSEISGNGHPSLLSLILNGFGLSHLHQNDDQTHEEKNEKGGVENEPGLKANGFGFFLRIHLDFRIEGLFPLF